MKLTSVSGLATGRPPRAGPQDPDDRSGTQGEVLVYRGVSKEFVSPKGSFTALSDVDLSVGKGEFVSIIGPSGCGKSTLLNLAAGLTFPTQGTVTFEGKRITRVNTSVGYVAQDNNLLPWRSVERNVALPLELSGTPRKERAARTREALASVGLEGFGDRYPSQLSGGMLKRTALARTLIYNPRTLLMDEPFGALDAQLRMSLQRDLMALWDRSRPTVLFITHDLEEAILLSDRVVVFGSRPGRIIHEQPIALARPRDIVELRTSPEFGMLWRRLWEMLEDQLADRS